MAVDPAGAVRAARPCDVRVDGPGGYGIALVLQASDPVDPDRVSIRSGVRVLGQDRGATEETWAAYTRRLKRSDKMVAAIRGCPDHQEAEWIAEQIEAVSRAHAPYDRAPSTGKTGPASATSS